MENSQLAIRPLQRTYPTCAAGNPSDRPLQKLDWVIIPGALFVVIEGLPEMPAPDAILFDIGDTLLEERRFDLEAGVRAVIGQRPEVVTDLCMAFRVHSRDNYLVDRELSLPEWIGEHLPHLENVSASTIEDTLWNAIVTLTPLPGVDAVPRRLRNDNVLLAAVSNAPFSGRILEAELEKHGLRHFFQFVLSSADVGFRKPHPEIFEAALLRLGVRSERTWFIGDTVNEDIVGAARAGLRPILFSRGASGPRCDPPTLQVSNWYEFESAYEKDCR